MARHFCIDFGNTQVKCALFERSKLLESHRFGYDEALPALQSFFETISAHHCNYSTVRPLPKQISEWLQAKNIEQVTTASPSPIGMRYETPETLGVDRYCNAIAGWSMTRPDAALVIDAGSCITYDLINSRGEYLGGAISPGYEMRMKAMHQFTGSLPLISTREIKPLIGTTTRGSMMLGAHQGMVEEVKGFIHYFEGLEPRLKTILTGGNQSIFEPHLENAIFAAQNLVLVGLNEVLLHAQRV